MKGVGWSKAAQKWRARVTINKRQKHLGVFDTKEGAHAACIAEAMKMHGEFARME